MNKLQESKNTSNKQLTALFGANATIIAKIPRMQAYVTEFGSNCEQLDTLFAQQKVPRGGAKFLKDKALDAVVAEVMNVAGRIKAYAAVNEMPDLLNRASITETKLRRLPDTEVTVAAAAIAGLATENAADITEFGVTKAITDQLTATIKAYDEAVSKPRMSKDEASRVNENINRIFGNNEVLFKKMDALVGMVKESDPDFYNSYFGFRKVVNYGRRPLALQVLVTDAATGEGLPKTQLLIEPAGNGAMKAASGANLVKVVKRTEAKGGSKLKSLPEGTYTITASRPGYATQTLSVTLVKGELGKVTIELAKE